MRALCKVRTLLQCDGTLREESGSQGCWPTCMCPSYTHSVYICIYINYYIIFIYIQLHLGYIYCVSVLSSFNFWILYLPTMMQPSQLLLFSSFSFTLFPNFIRSCVECEDILKLSWDEMHRFTLPQCLLRPHKTFILGNKYNISKIWVLFQSNGLGRIKGFWTKVNNKGY